jgi:hypothetical protein
MSGRMEAPAAAARHRRLLRVQLLEAERQLIALCLRRRRAAR